MALPIRSVGIVRPLQPRSGWSAAAPVTASDVRTDLRPAVPGAPVKVDTSCPIPISRFIIFCRIPTSTPPPADVLFQIFIYQRQVKKL